MRVLHRDYPGYARLHPPVLRRPFEHGPSLASRKQPTSRPRRMSATQRRDDGVSVASRTALGALWMIAWRFFSRLLGFFSTLIMARLLLPADFGLIAIATTLSTAV